MNSLQIYSFLFFFQTAFAAFDYIYGPGPLIKATKGEVWPKPQFQDKLDERYFSFVPIFFKFETTGNSCKTLTEALQRYEQILTFKNRLVKRIYYQPSTCYNFRDGNFLGYLQQLQVQLTGPCNDTEYPTIDGKEEYTLNITGESQVLTSDTIWGILRGLETFSQLIYITDDYSCHRIETTSIKDYPRFAHRSLLIDTARHFISESKILEVLDAMSYNKFNVFHWHMTDDQSFPYVSKTLPFLSEKGAYQPVIYTYQPDFVQEVIEYARKRGIRVLVEFDTPGHTLSWGLGAPDLLTKCYDVPLLEYGPIDPTKNSTYDLVFKLFDEVKEVFKDDYVHLGGDEVDFSCWTSNPDINDFMAANGIAGDYAALQSYYFQKLTDYVVSEKGLIPLVWEEVFTNNVTLPPNAVVNVWISTDPAGVTAEATQAGFDVVVSAYWYLDQLSTGGDWIKYYNPDPQNFTGIEEEKAKVIGVEATMWGEVVDDYNLESRIWPRACAAAERFWSSPEGTPPVLDIYSDYLFYDVGARMEEQTCRLNRRGITAQPPSGPSICY